MRTRDLVSALRSEGFAVTPAYLDFLIRERHLDRPNRDAVGYVWSDPDIQRVRSLLFRRNRGPQGAAYA